MKNILDYIQEIQEFSFNEKVLSDLDILALTEMCYLPFRTMISSSFDLDEGIPISQIGAWIPKFKQIRQETHNWMMISDERLRLVELLAQAPRYQPLILFAHLDDLDISMQKQFAAFSIQLSEKELLIIFRGTDETLIGWKEDFHMTFMPVIPAQKEALTYLQKALQHFSHDTVYYLAGHSKGGNLALFAASYLEPSLQTQLKTIYCFDAPGLHYTHRKQAGFEQILPKVKSFIPQNAIVGLLFDNPIPHQIVKSSGFIWKQHNTFTWNIKQNHFESFPYVTNFSQQSHEAFNQWINSLKEEELQQFSDTLYDILSHCGIQTLNDIRSDFFKTSQTLLEKSKEIDTKKREMILECIQQFIQIRKNILIEGWRQSHQERLLLVEDWIEEKLTHSLPFNNLSLMEFFKSEPTSTQNNEPLNNTTKDE